MQTPVKLPMLRQKDLKWEFEIQIMNHVIYHKDMTELKTATAHHNV